MDEDSVELSEEQALRYLEVQDKEQGIDFEEWLFSEVVEDFN